MRAYEIAVEIYAALVVYRPEMQQRAGCVLFAGKIRAVYQHFVGKERTLYTRKNTLGRKWYENFAVELRVFVGDKSQIAFLNEILPFAVKQLKTIPDHLRTGILSSIDFVSPRGIKSVHSLIIKHFLSDCNMQIRD